MAVKAATAAMVGTAAKEKAVVGRSRHYIHVPHSFGERLADAIAAGMGSWTFIIWQSAIVGVWIILNLLAVGLKWDPYPFILLNLLFSTQAAYAAPIIMMSQNRQDAKDRVRSELDYDVNRRSEIQIQGLARKLNLIADKIDDVEDLVRGKVNA